MKIINFVIKKIQNRFDIFELGNSFILWYFLIFAALPVAINIGIPFLFVSHSQDIVAFSSRTFFYLILGLIFFVFGHYFAFPKVSFSDKIFGFFKKEWDYQKSIWVFLAVFAMDFLVKSIRIFGDGYSHIKRSAAFMNSQFYSLIGLLDCLGIIAVIIAFSNYFDFLKKGDNRSRKWMIIAWGLLASEFLFGLFSLSRFEALAPVLAYLIVRHYLFERNYVKTFFIIMALLIIIFPGVSFIRNPGNYYSIDSRNVSIVENKSGNISAIASSAGEFISDSLLKRIGHSAVIVQNLFDKTDKFLYGKCITDIFVSLGPPRFIWKNKPSISSGGNDFGRRIGVLDSKDFTTSVGPTVVGDLYMNFGLSGIVFGMFFVGIIFRFIYELFIVYAKCLPAGIMFYVVAWIQLLRGSEDFIAPVWAGLIKTFVILAIINYFLIKKGKS